MTKPTQHTIPQLIASSLLLWVLFLGGVSFVVLYVAGFSWATALKLIPLALFLLFFCAIIFVAIYFAERRISFLKFLIISRKNINLFFWIKTKRAAKILSFIGLIMLVELLLQWRLFSLPSYYFYQLCIGLGIIYSALIQYSALDQLERIKK